MEAKVINERRGGGTYQLTGKLTADIINQINKSDDAQLLISPKDEETPCPWDPDWSVNGNNVVLTGNLTAGGPGSGGSTCVCTVPISNFTRYYDLSIDTYGDDELADYLQKNGFVED